MKRLLCGVLVLVSGCALSPIARHPVQPTPASWRAPAAYTHCRVLESIDWPDGRTRVLLECPREFVYVDQRTKAVIERVER